MRFFGILLIMMTAVAWLTPSARAFDTGPVDVHGFVSQGYLLSSENDYLAKTEAGSTEFNDVAVTLSKELTDKLRVGCQFLARDLGDAGNDKAGLDWGYGDYRWRDELGIRIGKVKRPMGLYNEGRDVDVLRTCILLPQSLYREDMRDIMNAAKGGSVYGTLPAGTLGSFDYQHVYGSKDMDLESMALKKQVAVRFTGVDVSDIQTDIRYTDTSHVVWNTPLRGLKLSASHETARVEFHSRPVAAVPTSDPDVVIPAIPAKTLKIDLEKVWVASAQYQSGDMTLTTEYADTVQEFSLSAGADSYRVKGHSTGYYGSVDYRFTPWFNLAAYYSVYYPDKNDKDGRKLAAHGAPDFMAWQKDACLSLRFDPMPDWVVKIEGHRINGAAQVFDYETMADLAERWNLFAAKITYVF